MFSEAFFGNLKVILQEVTIMTWRRQEEFDDKKNLGRVHRLGPGRLL